MNFLVFLLVGALAGWLAGMIMKGGGFGFLGNILVGVVGGFLGGIILGSFGLGGTGVVGYLVTAVIGAVVLLFLVGLIKKKK